MLGSPLRDYNINAPEERVNTRAQTCRAAALDAVFPHSVEVAQPDFTRKEKAFGMVH